VLVRCWNLFHGNAVPPERRAFLSEQLALATADDPGVLCVQEVPAWALGRFTVGDVASRPSVGPVPIRAAFGRRLTGVHAGMLRSAFSGQGNAIHVSPRLRVLAHEHLTLNSRAFRSEKGRELELDVVARLAWARERRIVQAVRLSDASGKTFLVANTHCTAYAPDDRMADAELMRAADFACGLADAADVVIIAGDFNVTPPRSRSLERLTGELGFSRPGPGIDQVLVRGAAASPVAVWPLQRRVVEGRVLSDHAPVEVTIE
jgi:exonuclease III